MEMVAKILECSRDGIPLAIDLRYRSGRCSGRRRISQILGVEGVT